ncbi:hypothetical protein Goari_022044 [Gossypium aridum]|uniref:Uncharacterized protein n=1 Tax=Gossypium aridum TaxID=34290 RepID=A0A7J8YSX9_GOSAI|nr:hypothetical protein [Gossypium aridum]
MGLINMKMRSNVKSLLLEKCRMK